LVHKFKVNNEMHGFIIMEYMDGTLEDYIKNNSNLSYDIIKKILADISAQIYCISKYDLMYTDIKMANILYKCNKSNKIIDFTLGDLGGITNKANKNADNKAIATFPAPERCIENCGVFLDPNEKDVVWSLGIMFLSMIGYNTYKYNFEDLMNLKKGGNIENLINESLVDTRKILDAKITGSVQPVVSEPGIVSNSGVDYFMEILTGMLKINKDERMTLHEVYVKARIIV
jgi:serine/threonine protein kinase